MQNNDSSPSSLTFSIGELSKQTQIPVSTLRTWERRYGVPSPAGRTEGGHRLYNDSLVSFLTLVKQAIDQGHRPKQLLAMQTDDLQRLLGVAPPPVKAAPTEPSPPTPEQTERVHTIKHWIALGREQQGEQLISALQQAWFQAGILDFLEDYLALFIREVGTQWEQGKLSVGEEHFISQHVRDFLTSQWRPMSKRAKNPKTCVCANLPGEEHTLGLNMVATILAVHGYKILYLGANVPLFDLISMSQKSSAFALCVSISEAMDEKKMHDIVRALGLALPKSTNLLLGGSGAQKLVHAETHPQTHIINTLRSFDLWLQRA